MLEEYPGELLPPSAENPIQAIPIELEDGTIVEWAGKWASKSPKSVYGKRRRMFKGTKAERDRAGRDQDRKERMGGMEKRIAEWKKVRSDNRAMLTFRPRRKRSFRPSRLCLSKEGLVSCIIHH